MLSDKYNLTRFLDAQEVAYSIALEELQNGCKRTHWMWYIFPQLKHLGRSFNSTYFGISGIMEASAYLAHPVLNERLRAVSEATLNLPTTTIEDLFGIVDSCKLRSSMTLFDMVSPNDIFARVIEKFFNGQPDCRTINIIKSQNEAV